MHEGLLNPARAGPHPSGRNDAAHGRQAQQVSHQTRRPWRTAYECPRSWPFPQITHASSVETELVTRLRIRGPLDLVSEAHWPTVITWRDTAVRRPGPGRPPKTRTRIDRDYEHLREDMRTLFHDLALNTAA